MDKYCFKAFNQREDNSPKIQTEKSDGCMHITNLKNNQQRDYKDAESSAKKY